MKVPCIIVSRRSAEIIRRTLVENDLIRTEYKLKSVGDKIAIPVKEDDPFVRELVITEGLEISDIDLEQRMIRPSSYKDILELPGTVLDDLPSSYDIIGDVAIIKLDEKHRKYKEEIGKALLDFNKKLRSAAVDNGVKGEYRIRDLEVIYGNNDTETTHLENNIRLRLDPSKVYFSPRLATERMRIAKITGEEKILDMFAGIGPFALTIARHSRAKKVIGIDLNPDCIFYFNRNIDLNSVSDTVEAHLGDSSEISSAFAPFDRIVMNLPHTSMDHLGSALELMESGYIHLYLIIEDEDVMSRISDMSKIAGKADKDLNITDTRVVHNYSPGSSLMVFDLKVSDK